MYGVLEVNYRPYSLSYENGLAGFDNDTVQAKTVTVQAQSRARMTTQRNLR